MLTFFCHEGCFPRTEEGIHLNFGWQIEHVIIENNKYTLSNFKSQELRPNNNNNNFYSALPYHPRLSQSPSHRRRYKHKDIITMASKQSSLCSQISLVHKSVVSLWLVRTRPYTSLTPTLIIDAAVKEKRKKSWYSVICVHIAALGSLSSALCHALQPVVARGSGGSAADVGRWRPSCTAIGTAAWVEFS